MAEKSNTQTREFTFDLEGRDAASDGIPVVVSSDAIVEMEDGPEILVHTREAVDLQRAPLPIIASHRDGQVNVGIIDGLNIVNGTLRGMATFGTRPEANGYREDVLNRIIRSVSVGYARIKATMRADGVMLTTRWIPMHAAMVAQPADVRAGFFRSLESVPALEIDSSATQAQIAAAVASAPNAPLSTITSAARAAMQVSQPAARAASPKEAKMADVIAAAGTSAEPHQANLPAQAKQGPSAMDIEKNRVRGIENMCKANKIDDNIKDHWVGTGLPLEDISEEILQITTQRAAGNKSVAALGLTEDQTKNFSLFRAIRATADKNWTNAGFELECSREVAKKMNKVTDPNRFYVPYEVQERQVQYRRGQTYGAGAHRGTMMDMLKRDLTVGTTTAGGFLVETSNVSFVEMLRNRAVAYRMGARRLSGLVGNVSVPKQTAAATAVWLANEASTLTESQQTFAQMALSPKTVGAYTEISRQLLLQSSPDAEGIVTSDLASVTALAYDLGVLSGSGASGQPTGITNTAGIGSVTGTSLAFAGILEFQTDVAGANVMPAAGGYATTHAVASLMIQRVKYTSTASPVWEGNVWDGSMQGFPAMGTNQMAAASMIFGDWSQVVVAEWGVLEIEVNPYANFQAGIIGVRAIVSMDCGLRYPAAFSLATSIT